MSKSPDTKNLSEYSGTIELEPEHFEKVSDGIREAKSYLALAANHLGKYSLKDVDGVSPVIVKSAIGNLSENLSIAGDQAINLNPEATAGLDILRWTIDHAGEEASGVIPTGPLSATAWLGRQIQSVDLQTGYADESLYITAWQRTKMKLELSRDAVGTETFRVNQATVYSPRRIQTEIRPGRDGLIAFTIVDRGSKGKKFTPRVKHLTHSGRTSAEELVPTEALVEILPGTEIDISALDKRISGDAKWGAFWLDYLGERKETEKLTRDRFPVATPEEACSVGPINLRNNKNRRSLTIGVSQLGQFPYYESGISVNVRAGKKSQEIKFRPSDLPATIFLPGENFAKSSGTTTAETAKLLDRQLENFAQALLDMTAVEIDSK